MLQAWKLPGCELEGNVCRFELPVRALAVSPNGTQVASGGDDGMLKVSRIEDKRVSSWQAIHK
jgi:WD40 repeat protein